MVLGTPRSGKGVGVVIPSTVAHPGPVVVTSSKWDLFGPTVRERAAVGPVWVFTLDGQVPAVPGVRVGLASWNPVQTSVTLDDALRHAHAMVGAARSGLSRSGEEQYWYNHAERLIGCLLRAAHASGGFMEHVAAWVLSGDLTGARAALAAAGESWAELVLARTDAADERHRDGVLSTAADVLRVYDNADVRALARRPTFDAETFVRGTGTVYVIAPSDEQRRLAPVVVGLVTDIVRAAFASAGSRPVLGLFLDELRGIAPLPDLPMWLSEAGSLGVQVLGVLQDLSQARDLYGPNVGDGLLTLFRWKVLLPGLMDRATLEVFSMVLGEEVVSPAGGAWATRPRYSPNAIAALPPGTGLCIDRGHATELRMLTHRDHDYAW